MEFQRPVKESRYVAWLEQAALRAALLGVVIGRDQLIAVVTLVKRCDYIRYDQVSPVYGAGGVLRFQRMPHIITSS